MRYNFRFKYKLRKSPIKICKFNAQSIKLTSNGIEVEGTKLISHNINPDERSRSLEEDGNIDLKLNALPIYRK